MALKSIVRKPGRIFYGWWVIAACAVISGVGLTFFTMGFSVTFLPISRELGLNRATLSLVASLSRGEGALEAVAVGWLIDRLGPRLLMMVGLGIAGVGYLLLTQVHSFGAFILVYLAFVSLGAGAGLHAPVTAAANTWFRRHRGLAMSMSLTGGTVGGAVLIPLYSAVVLAYGWRNGVVMVGLIYLLLLLPLALVVRRSPESMGLRPDGERVVGTMVSEASVPVAVRPAEAEEMNFTIKEAMRTRSFWMLTLAMGLFGLAFGAMLVHFIPILVWRGLEQQQAANVMGLMYLGTVVTRPSAGWMGDRWSKSKLLALGMFSGMGSLLLFAYRQSMGTIWLGAVFFGLMTSFLPLQFAICGDYFGRKNFATLRGLSQFFTSPMSMGAPFLAGLVYDRTQSYELALGPMAGLFAVAAVTYALLRAPRKPQRAEVSAH